MTAFLGVLLALVVILDLVVIVRQGNRIGLLEERVADLEMGRPVTYEDPPKRLAQGRHRQER